MNGLSTATASAASSLATATAPLVDPNTEFHALLHVCTVSSWRRAIALADEPKARSRIDTSRSPATRVGAGGAHTSLDPREKQYAIALWLNRFVWSLDDSAVAEGVFTSAAESQQIVNRVFDILMETGARPLLRRSIIARGGQWMTPIEWICYDSLLPHLRCVLRQRTAGGPVDLFARSCVDPDTDTDTDTSGGGSGSGATATDSVPRVLHYALASHPLRGNEFSAAEVDGAETATATATAAIAAGTVRAAEVARSHSLTCELIRRAIDTNQYDALNATPHFGSALHFAVQNYQNVEFALLLAAPPPSVELDVFDPPSDDGSRGGSWVRARRWLGRKQPLKRAEAAWAQFRVERSALLRSIGSAWGLIPELCEIVDSYGRAVTDADFHAAEAERRKREAESEATRQTDVKVMVDAMRMSAEADSAAASNAAAAAAVAAAAFSGVEFGAPAASTAAAVAVADADAPPQFNFAFTTAGARRLRDRHRRARNGRDI